MLMAVDYYSLLILSWNQLRNDAAVILKNCVEANRGGWDFNRRPRGKIANIGRCLQLTLEEILIHISQLCHTFFPADKK